MSLSPIHVYQPGEVLTADNLNNSVQQPLQNPIGLISPTSGAINFNNQAHTNLPLASVSGSSGTAGLVATLGAALVPVWAIPLSAQPARMGVNGLVGSVTSSQTCSFAFEQATVLTTDKLQSFSITATSSFNISAGSSGPGGRDQAAVFASTFAHAFVITTGLNSTTPTGLLSTSLVPVLPTSYTAYAYLATMQYSSASTGFSGNHTVRGADVFYSSMRNVASALASTAEQTISLVSAVPPNALIVRARYQYANLGAPGASSILRLVSGLDYYAVDTSGNAEVNQASIEFPNVSQSLLTLVSAPGGTVGTTIDIQGYTVANGG